MLLSSSGSLAWRHRPDAGPPGRGHGNEQHATGPIATTGCVDLPSESCGEAGLGRRWRHRTVGTGKQYRTAAAAARNGDVIQVQAGTYTNDFAILGMEVTIVGVGGMARLVATTTDVALDHGEFAGARVADRNGAGIRYEGGKLTVRKCYFHDTWVGHHIKSRASKTTVAAAASSTARTVRPATASTCRRAGRRWSAITSSSGAGSQNDGLSENEDYDK